MKAFSGLMRTLAEADVAYILIGGVAAVLHGSARFTFDLDVLYSRTPENIKNIVEALRPFEPYPRGAPPGLPFLWDVETVQAGLNFTLTTKIGAVDLFGEIAGGGTYETLFNHSIVNTVFGVKCRYLDLTTLIAVKTAAGRPKDFEAISELQVILEETNQPKD